MVGSFSLVEVVFETWSNLLLNPEEGFHLDIIIVFDQLIAILEYIINLYHKNT